MGIITRRIYPGYKTVHVCVKLAYILLEDLSDLMQYAAPVYQ